MDLLISLKLFGVAFPVKFADVDTIGFLNFLINLFTKPHLTTLIPIELSSAIKFSATCKGRS